MIRTLLPLRRISRGNARAGEHGFPGIPLRPSRERRYRIAKVSERPDRSRTVRTFASRRVLRESRSISPPLVSSTSKSQRLWGKESMSSKSTQIEAAFRIAAERYHESGVDVERACTRLAEIALSLHCWQGDDVGGFEDTGAGARRRAGGHRQLSGQGPHRRRARDPTWTRRCSLIPGTHRLNLHASYAETGGRQVERNALWPEHFRGWIDWAKARRIGMDFNPTLLRPSAWPPTATPWPIPTRRSADSGSITGSPAGGSAPRSARRWATRASRTSGSPTAPRTRPSIAGPARAAGRVPRRDLRRADRPGSYNRDAVEGKLFGIGSESYVVGSHEFYLGYAVTRKKLLCLDAGHYHPTEVVSDKISAVLSCTSTRSCCT